VAGLGQQCVRMVSRDDQVGQLMRNQRAEHHERQRYQPCRAPAYYSYSPGRAVRRHRNSRAHFLYSLYIVGFATT
jgi:hypothetical protein